MALTADWHIHSEASCDAASLKISDLIAEAPSRGILDCGVTDHVHTPVNLPDLAASRRAFLAAKPQARFHFGVEVSCVSQWELDEIASGRGGMPVYGLRQGGPPECELAIGLTEQDIEHYGVEYVIGGVHWPMYTPLEREAIIRDYHRQNMFLVQHPLIDVVAHPWWWMKHWQNPDGLFLAEPWFDSFDAVPASMHDEFASAAIACGKVVEINIGAMLLTRKYSDHFKRQYIEYLAYLHARGVKLSTGSDCHSAHYDTQFSRAAAMLSSVGICDCDLWRLPPRRK